MRISQKPMTEYQEYLETPHWQQKRAEALARSGGKCSQCGATENLDVHHKTYVRLGAEELADLVVLCRDCHFAKHRRQRYDRAVNTFATKKYGEDWDRFHSPEDVEIEFDEWLDSRD